MVEQQPQDEQAVAQGAGNDDGVQPGELVGDEVVVGDAPPGAEVFRVGPGVGGTAGRHEADAIGRGYLAAAPDVGDRQRVLRRHDLGIGGGDGVRPDEVLADPGQPVSAERRLVSADQRFEADVASLRDQPAAQTGGEVLDAGMTLADMGEGVGKAGARCSFQHDVRQADLRYPRRNGRLQSDQAGRALELIERGQHQLVPAIAAFDLGRLVVGQVGRNLAPCKVQPGGKIAHLRFGVRRAVERPPNGQSSCVPGFATQQALSRIGITNASRDEHVTPLQSGAKGFQGGEDIGAVIDDPASTIQGMAPPGRRQKASWRLGHAGADPVTHAPQVIQRRDHGLTCRRCVECSPLQQGGEQRSDPSSMRPQFLVAPVVGLGDQAIDAGHGGLDVRSGDLLEQGALSLADRQCGILVGHDMLAHVAQHDGGSIEVTQRAQPGFTVRLFCLGEDVGRQGIERLNRVVERRGLQGLEQGSKRGGAPRLLQCRQIGWLDGACAARQAFERGRRQIRRPGQAQTVAADGIDPLQTPQQLRGRAAFWGGAQIFQRRGRLIIGGDQGDKFRTLLGGQGLCQALPEPQSGAMAHTADQALQCRNPGQQHLVRQQPRGGPVEQQTRPVVSSPAQHVEPPGQPEAGARVLFQIAEPVVVADDCAMTPALPAIAVGLQARRRTLAGWRAVVVITAGGVCAGSSIKVPRKRAVPS